VNFNEFEEVARRYFQRNYPDAYKLIKHNMEIRVWHSGPKMSPNYSFSFATIYHKGKKIFEINDEDIMMGFPPTSFRAFTNGI